MTALMLTDVLNVLVIEDNEDDFVLLEAFLDSAEFALTWCSSAFHARETLATERFDLVLLDHGLPDTNALTFMRELTASYANLPIIILTGHEDQSLAVSAIKQGAANYILKDEIANHLLPAIYEIIERNSTIQSYVTQPAPTTRFIDTADNIYETLLETMTDGCLVVAYSGNITFANAALAQLAQREIPTLLGQHLSRLFPTTAQRQMKRLQDGCPITCKAVEESELQRADGSKVAVRLAARRLREGRAILFIVSDISAEVETRTRLASLYQQAREGRSRLQAIIESSGDGLLFITSTGEIQTINHKAIALLSHSLDADDWIGMPVSQLQQTLSAVWQPLMSEIETVLQQVGIADATDYEIEFRQKVIQSQLILVMDGAVALGVLVILRDVTALREAEHLRRDLTNALVHDLRSPLSAANTALQMVLQYDAVTQNTLSDKQRHYVNVSLQSNQVMLNLVNTILDLAQIENGHLSLQRREVEVGVLVEEVRAAHLVQAQLKGVRLLTAIPSTLPVLSADEELLRRVLQNLIDNAIKFTPSGGGVVISAEYAPNNNQLLLHVSDSGVGISAALRGRLFQKFAKGDQPERGTGLGLAFCKLAVEAHGGTLSVDSNTGNGSTFTIMFPC